MAKNYGLTDSGFILPALDSLIEETKESLKSLFGENFNTQSNSVADKLTSILNEREYQIYLLAGSVFSAQTMQGAEGIYLDDLLGKRGIYRRGKTRSNGQVEMTVDATVPYNMTYSAATYSIDSGNFVLTRDTSVAGNLIAQIIKSTDLVIGNYRLQIQNTNDRTIKQITLNLTNRTPGSPELTSFYNSIKTFIVDNTILSNQDRILIDSVEGSIYIGYDTNKEMVGLSSRVDFRTSPLAGNKTITLDVRAVEAGALTREANTVTNISPWPSGFVEMTNIRAFSDGSDVESDNEYRVRAASTVSGEGGKATRPAIITTLLNTVEGVEKVRIFANNTDRINSLGIPPYKFEVVIYGGSTEDISIALYNTIALSNCTYGTTFFDVTTEDDQIERIYHTKAEARRLSIRVRYKAARPLALGEEQDVSRSLANLISQLKIADTIYNIQLVSAVGAALASGRFTQLVVEVKNLTDPDSSYSTVDVIGELNEVFALDENDVEFGQII